MICTSLQTEFACRNSSFRFLTGHSKRGWRMNGYVWVKIVGTMKHFNGHSFVDRIVRPAFPCRSIPNFSAKKKWSRFWRGYSFWKSATVACGWYNGYALDESRSRGSEDDMARQPQPTRYRECDHWDVWNIILSFMYNIHCPLPCRSTWIHCIVRYNK